MAVFDTVVRQDARRRVLRALFSTDRFSTTSHYYSDVAAVIDGVQHSARVVSVGTVRRALGQDRIAASGTTELILNNADGGCDWLCGRESISTAAALRVRLYVTLLDDTGDAASKLLGEFVLSEWPRQDNETVVLPLADDMLGGLQYAKRLPTPLDWRGVGTAATNPFFYSLGLADAMPETAPFQLAFGEDWVRCHPHMIPWESTETKYRHHVIVPVCATTDTGTTVSQDEISRLCVEVVQTDGNVKLVEIPRSGSALATPYAFTTLDVIAVDNWTVERSPVITVDGTGFVIIYLVVRCDVTQQFWSEHVYRPPVGDAHDMRYAGGYPPSAVEWVEWTGPTDTEASGYPGFYSTGAARVVSWFVKGSRLSSRTVVDVEEQHAVDVLRDLADYYSEGAAIAVDAASAARVKAGNRFGRASGVHEGWVHRQGAESYIPASMRQALTEVCQSCDLDIFVNWDGELAFASDVYDFTTATQAGSLVEIAETAVSDLVRWCAGEGERGAVFNRLWMTGAKYSPPDGVYEAPYQGPWDFESGVSVLPSVRILECVMPQGWRPVRQQGTAPFWWRQLNVVARDRIRFRTHIEGLRLDLGDYFKLTWTRGPDIGGPYSASVFQVESIAYAPDGDTVEIEALWRDDTTTERAYLLDDEALLVRSKGAGASTVEAIASSTGINLTGTVDLVAMGVSSGDILVLRDSAQAGNIYSLNAAFRIASVDGSDALTLVTAPTATNLAILNADWAIYRGATTYPTAVGDPTNYPSGGDMYGKVTESDGTYSDSTDGNRLISG